MRLFPRSIRWRLHLWHGLLLAVVLCGFGWTVHRLEWTNELRRVDAELQQRMNTLLGLLGRPPGPQGRPPGPPRAETLEDFFPLPEDARPPPPRQDRNFDALSRWVKAGRQQRRWFIAWSREGGILVAEGVDKNPRSKPDTTRMEPLTPYGFTVRAAGEAPVRELMALTPPGDVVLVGRCLLTEAAASRRSALRFAGLGGLVWLLGVAGGGWLTTRALRPIQTVTDTAAAISAGHLDSRINVEETDTELGRMAGVLNDTFSRLRQAFDQQARFTADAAHELRTPVTVMLSQIQLALNRERSPQEYRGTLDTCQRAAERMSGLIESLLELAQMDAGADPLEVTESDLATVAADCAAMMESLAAERGLVLEKQLSCAPCRVDEKRAAQVITNFLSNALRHTPSGGVVTVRAGVTDGRAWVSVADQGPGIPMEHRARLFDRFYRVENSRNRGSGGAGLGLAICKAIADAHGAVISIEDAEGGGSVFTFTMPSDCASAAS